MSDAFMINVRDWLSSSAVAGMSAAEERGYLRMLMHLWQSMQKGHGLPNDEQTLSRMALLSIRAWRGQSGTRLRSCFELRDGEWWNSRMDRELANYETKRTAQSLRGGAGAKARWKGREARQERHSKSGMERSGSILATIGFAGHRERTKEVNSMPEACVKHEPGTEIERQDDAAGVLEPSLEHATSYSVQDTKRAEAASESEGVVEQRAEASPLRKPVESAAATPTGRASSTDVEQAQMFMRECTGKSDVPDLTIVLKTLATFGSLALLMQFGAEMRKRKKPIESYGFFTQVGADWVKQRGLAAAG